MIPLSFFFTSDVNPGLLHIHITSQKIHIYNYVKLHIIIFHQYVSVTRVVIIKISYTSKILQFI